MERIPKELIKRTVTRASEMEQGDSLIFAQVSRPRRRCSMQLADFSGCADDLGCRKFTLSSSRGERSVLNSESKHFQSGEGDFKRS